MTPQGSNAWLAAVFTAARDAIVVAADDRIVAVNPAGGRLLGYANASELVGQPTAILGAAPGEKPLIEADRVPPDAGSPEPFGFAARRKDGLRIQLEATMQAAALAGMSHWIIVLRELPPRTDFAAQQLAAMGRLTDGVAHDFNNLLTAIRCQTELVLLSQTIPVTVREMLQKVIAATDRATNLTRQLRAFSRRQPLQPTSVDLNALLGNLTKMLQRWVGEGIALRQDAATNLPPIHADPSVLEQVILDLAVNAREAMPQGGTLTLATAVFHADGDYLRRQPAARSGEFVVLAVSDTGGGIAPELRPRIFEPAFTTKPTGKGNGLGLAAVWELIQQHQGWLEVESQVGQGTSLRIFLPARRDLALAAAQFSPPAVANGGKETLLVVADDRELRQLIRLTLQKLGYQVLEAASEAEALQVWGRRAGDIQLVLTERLMANGASGTELIKRWRAGKPELKAMVMSDRTSNQPAADRPLPAAVGWLAKPLDPGSLAQRVRRCLDETSVPQS